MKCSRLDKVTTFSILICNCNDVLSSAGPLKVYKVILSHNLETDYMEVAIVG